MVQAQQKQDNAEAVIRFNISSHLRGAEAEIDGLHGRLLAAQQKGAELEQKLSETQKEIEELKAKYEPKKVAA